MIKAIIVDDEEIIRRGISDFIEWASLGIELSGQASNGMEAGELICVVEPDIIITDVKMPRMNGIDLLSMAKTVKPDCSVIMISSYDQFEYAQKSLNLGAYAYLLKPIDTDELTALLKEVVKKITNISQEKELLDNYRGEVKQAHMDILDNKLKILVFGGREEELKKEETDYLDQFKSYTILTVRTQEPVFREESFAAELKGRIEVLLQRFQYDVVAKRFQNQNQMNIYLLLNRKEEPLSLYRTLYEVYKNFYQKTIFGVSEKLDSVKQLSAAYAHSLEALEYSFFTDEHIIYYRDVQREVTSFFRDMPDWSLLVREALGAGDGSKVKELMDMLLEHIYIQKPCASIRGAAVSAILFELIKKIRSAGGKPEDVFLSVTDLIDSILSEKNPALMVQKLNNALTEAHSYVIKLEEMKPNSLVFKAKRYIEENFSKPELGLEEIAAHLYINASYLSAVFSKEFSVSLSGYITQVRMEKATYLLENTNYKIYEVAEQVGYHNISWFNVAFKKYSGKKPGDVRNGVKSSIL